MRVLCIDVQVQHPAASFDYFAGVAACLDFDAVIVDVRPFVENSLRAAKHWPANGFLSHREGKDIERVLSRRSHELREFLAHGRPILSFPFAYAPIPFLNASGNAHEVLQLNHYLQGWGEDVEIREGERVEVKGPSPYAEFLRSLSAYFSYEQAYVRPPDVPLAYIQGSTRVLSALYRTKYSWHVVAPRMRTLDDNYPADLVDRWIELIRATNSAPDFEAVPAWAALHLVCGESAKLQALEDLRIEQAKLQSRTDTVARELERLQNVKRLFTASGKTLEVAVAEALRALGFAVDAGPTGRDDLIATDGDKVLVVEVKGREKSAGERDAAQLEKWVLRHFEDTGVRPKGLLVVNGYRDQPLDARDEPVFPHQMLDFSERRQHCLITGVQLACLQLTAHSEQTNLAVREQIFFTDGLLPMFNGDEWRNVILLADSAQPEQARTG